MFLHPDTNTVNGIAFGTWNDTRTEWTPAAVTLTGENIKVNSDEDAKTVAELAAMVSGETLTHVIIDGYVFEPQKITDVTNLKDPEGNEWTGEINGAAVINNLLKDALIENSITVDTWGSGNYQVLPVFKAFNHGSTGLAGNTGDTRTAPLEMGIQAQNPKYGSLGYIKLNGDGSFIEAYTGTFTNAAVSGTLTVGRLYSAADIVVDGNLTVNGTTTVVDAENLLIKDKYITLGLGEEDATSGATGILFNKWSSDNSAALVVTGAGELAFDNSVVLSEDGGAISAAPNLTNTIVALRDGTFTKDNAVTGVIPIWDLDNKKFTSSGITLPSDDFITDAATGQTAFSTKGLLRTDQSKYIIPDKVYFEDTSSATKNGDGTTTFALYNSVVVGSGNPLNNMIINSTSFGTAAKANLIREIKSDSDYTKYGLVNKAASVKIVKDRATKVYFGTATPTNYVNGDVWIDTNK